MERYVRQNPTVSVQSKINMLNSRLRGKIKEEFLGKGIKYTEAERKAILKAYRGHYGGRVWKQSIFELYQDFLRGQREKGFEVDIPEEAFDVYDLAALAYIYKRVKETEVISEAHHVVIDEAQDFGMMAYHVLKFCIYRCTYTIMGDVSQNIHFGYGLDDWEELKALFLPDSMDSFGILKKSYRNTVEISDFATNILHHGRFSVYPVEPIIRHGNPVQVRQLANRHAMIRAAADICKAWQTGESRLADNSNALDTIAVVCRDQKEASHVAQELSKYIDVVESDPEKTEFGSGIMVLPVEYTKGLEFDAVLIMNPSRETYPTDDGHAKLLYVAATRALHELCVLHTGNLTGLIADPVSGSGTHGREINDSADSRGRTEAAMPTLGSVERPLKKKISIALSKPGIAPKPDRLSESDTAFRTKAMAETNTVGGVKERKHDTAHGNRAPMQLGYTFGDMPPTEKLRPAGHGKIDLAVKWITKQQDGLYLHSRYGVLRLSPIGSAIIRVTFAKAVRSSIKSMIISPCIP